MGVWKGMRPSGFGGHTPLQAGTYLPYGAGRRADPAVVASWLESMKNTFKVLPGVLPPYSRSPVGQKMCSAGFTLGICENMWSGHSEGAPQDAFTCVVTKHLH